MSGNDDSFLPEENLPECWKDEERMNVLFAPFRNRSVNPKDWDSKLLFWKNLLADYCIYKKKFKFKLSELRKAFNRNGRSPACLEAVIDELYKTAELKTLNEFLQKPAETWTTWAVDVLIRKPVVWSFNKVKSKVATPDTADVIYVHLYAVETVAEKFISHIPAKLDKKVISLKKLSEIQDLKVESLEIILHYLSCKGKASVRDLQSKEGKHLDNTILVKICDVKKHGPITNVDVDVYILEQSEESLIKDIEKLEIEASTLVTDAKSYLIKGHRQTAKTSLRKKRDVERCIERRTNALNNIQTLLSRIQDIDSDIQVLDSYKSALSRLRGVFSESGITEEVVSNTMLELDEVLELHSDIQSTLAQTNLSTADSDLEAELAELIASEEKKSAEQDVKDDEDLAEQMEKLDIKLPFVPKKELEVKAKISL